MEEKTLLKNAFCIATDIMTLHTLSEHCFNHESKFRIHGFDNFVSPTVVLEIRDYLTNMVSHNFEMEGLLFFSFVHVAPKMTVVVMNSLHCKKMIELHLL